MADSNSTIIWPHNAQIKKYKLTKTRSPTIAEQHLTILTYLKFQMEVCFLAESCKIMFLWDTSYSLVQTLLLKDVLFSQNAQRHRQIDRQALSCHRQKRGGCTIFKRGANTKPTKYHRKAQFQGRWVSS